MLKITCDYCYEDHLFEKPENRPATCSNCNTPLDHLEIKDAAADSDVTETTIQNKLPDGLMLTSQKSGEVINIQHDEIIILGRQNAGKDIFSNIPQISREHCKIECFDGKYYLTDLNSMNGTYLGTSKRDCRKHMKQEIRENDVIYLGREAFNVVVKYRLAEGDDVSQKTTTEEEIPEIKFKCKACGKIHEMNLLICDNCGSYGQIEPLED